MPKKRSLRTDDIVIKITNVRLIRDHKIIKEDLWIQNGKFIDPQKRFWKLKKGADVVVDGKGLLVAPGFIDIQINGAFGVDFSSPKDVENGGLKTVANGLLKHGVTSFLPTIITSEPSTYQKLIPLFEQEEKEVDTAEILGLHLEGPFINVLKYGAHKKEFVKNECPNGFQTILDVYGSLKKVKVITVAPELPGMLDTIGKLKENGIIVSAGHSMASIKQAEKAVEQGVSLITHLFNAMIPFHHRDPGLVGLLGTNDRQVFYSLIVDGIHSHPASVKIAYKAYPEGAILITDAMEAMGLSPGTYQLGTMTVNITNHAAYIEGTETLAGSIATMDALIRNFQECTGCSIVEAIEAATLHPAKLLGLEHHKGSLDFGCDADLVLLDDSLHVQATFRAGLPVYVGTGIIDLSSFH